MTLPGGIVTFLFTDIEGSTRLWEDYPERMEAASSQHDDLMRQIIEQNGGQVVKSTGDGFHAVFSSATHAVSAALAGQSSIQKADWGLPEAVRVRMGLHSGEAQLREGDYYGSAVNRAARLMGAGSGGQVLLSDVTAKLIRESLPAGAELVDLGEYYLRDLALPERVFQLNGAGLPADFPELKTTRSTRHNLPESLTSFVGRERESVEVIQLLGSTRLLTLIGVGGTGKTRLMLHTANNCLDQYRHGVWLVELAALTEPEQICGQVASALSLREIPGRSLQDVLVDYLRHKQTLLLLDNCEHLIGESARLAQVLLNDCPELTILATSREGLGIGGESIYQVPSLSIPTNNGAKETGELMAYESVRLFVERAQAASPGFHLSPANTEAILVICQRLDGIPLAIELAAVRVRMLSPEQIASRLQDHFRLLAGGSRTALPRQQTLQALIDWSWDLLNEDERKLLSRLAVFSGGWQLEAAEAIVNDTEGDQLDVLEGLFNLVNKSVVIAEQLPDGNTRYHLLETIRQYARERLIEAGEIAHMRARHAEYFAGFVSDLRDDMMEEGSLDWLEMLDADYNNIRAALEWNLEHQPFLAVKMVRSMQPFYIVRSLIGEGISWSEEAFQAALSVLPSRDDPTLNERRALLAPVRAYQALMMVSQGGSQKWMRIAEEALELARQSQDRDALSICLGIAGFVFGFANKSEQAVAYAREGREISYQVNNLEGLGLSLRVLTMAAIFVNNDIEEENMYIEEITRWYQAFARQWLVGNFLLGQGQIALRKGQFSEAIAYYEESIDVYGAQGNSFFANVARSDSGHVYRNMGDLDKAIEIYTETILIWQDLGHRGAVANQLECFGFIAVEVGQWERAARLLGAAEALREAADTPMLIYEQKE
ncbi:MAG: adenylate/guanylate cyclase domain-containing protein, partial [Anaerolineales bacterium]